MDKKVKRPYAKLMLMKERKTYGQYCGLAKALDHVGGRWTLLIVRELLIGPRRYSKLRAALPGIATNLLADRLDALEADGLIERSDEGYYSLTDKGYALEGAILALVRWGGRWMGQRTDEEVFRPQWLLVALRSLLPPRRPGSVEFLVDGEVVHVGRSIVGLGPINDPDAVIEAPPEKVLAVAAGRAPLSTLKVTGDRKVAAAVLQAHTGSGKVDKVNLVEKLSRLDALWSPKIVAALNDYKIALVKVKGEFVWHKHVETDDFFLVLDGKLTIQLRDRDVVLGPGELFVVPRGVEHRPRAKVETHMLLIEPTGTSNTGDAGGDLTAEEEWI